ncbi:hypothetical protein Plhal304r1_c066g0154581 [Plasmopara halstedii]
MNNVCLMSDPDEYLISRFTLSEAYLYQGPQLTVSFIFVSINLFSKSHKECYTIHNIVFARLHETASQF